MTAYNHTDLKNLFIRQQADEAVEEQYISAEIKEEIFSKHPVTLYSPNVAVKIGLGVLTAFIILATLGLCALLFNVKSFDTFLLFMGTACYVVLEVMTSQNKHYNSGVDNVLMFAVVILISSGLSIDLHHSEETVLSLVVFMLSAWFAIRFADSLAGIVAPIALLSFVFNFYVSLGEFTISTFPFMLIILSGAFNFLANKKSNSIHYSIYQPVWKAASVTALIALYLCGNYYVVAELTDTSYLVTRNSALHLWWFFWSYTMLVPVVYLWRGIRRRDVIMLRVSILLIAASVLTFRYYHEIISSEAAMLLAGSLLLMISYALMKLLKTNRYGFVFDDGKNRKNKHANLEAFVIGEAFGSKHQAVDETRFGGGSFGGAGAGDKY